MWRRLKASGADSLLMSAYVDFSVFMSILIFNALNKVQGGLILAFECLSVCMCVFPLPLSSLCSLFLSPHSTVPCVRELAVVNKKE